MRRSSNSGMSHDRELKLGAFLPAAGHHVAAWRHPSARADGGVNLKHYVQPAQTAERAKLDAIFLADGLASNFFAGAEGKTACGGTFEPVTSFSARSPAFVH
jgi:alkanesulfonate monooxygenase